MRLDPQEIKRCVSAALEEDLARAGDITTSAIVPADRRSRGLLLAREELVLAGLPLARAVFDQVDPELEFDELAADGELMRSGDVAATVEGCTRSILIGERTALNFLMRMSGIASAARRATEEIAGTSAKILDTRKTAPGLRHLDKYAVAAGGATNHRMGLYDAAMIKDTHLDAGLEIGQAVRRLIDAGIPPERITVEVRDLKQLQSAVEAGSGRALLDNMDLETMRRCVEAAAGALILEASGGLQPGALRAVAETGVDCISLGWLTHSTPAADLSLKMERRS